MDEPPELEPQLLMLDTFCAAAMFATLMLVICHAVMLALFVTCCACHATMLAMHVVPAMHAC